MRESEAGNTNFGALSRFTSSINSKASSLRGAAANKLNKHQCKTDKDILVVRIGQDGQDDFDTLMCQSKEERDEWLAALEAHKFSSTL
jgi:hypothetical protein